jgi:hypothetical protein
MYTCTRVCKHAHAHTPIIYPGHFTEFLLVNGAATILIKLFEERLLQILKVSGLVYLIYTATMERTFSKRAFSATSRMLPGKKQKL